MRMERLSWALLGFVIFPLWLAAGFLDYALHRRTSIATTAGLRETRYHLVQMVQVGLPVLAVLFLELTPVVLVALVLLALAHTRTAYRDIRYANARRAILPLEQFVHAFLIGLPLFATALLVLMHWPLVHGPAGSVTLVADAWGLRWRDPMWDAGIIAAVLAASFLFAVLPALFEYREARRAAMPGRASPGVAGLLRARGRQV
jgi:hypothetical protein